MEFLGVFVISSDLGFIYHRVIDDLVLFGDYLKRLDGIVEQDVEMPGILFGGISYFRFR